MGVYFYIRETNWPKGFGLFPFFQGVGLGDLTILVLK